MKKYVMLIFCYVGSMDKAIIIDARTVETLFIEGITIGFYILHAYKNA